MSNVNNSSVSQGFLSWDLLLSESRSALTYMYCSIMVLSSGIQMYTCPIWRFHGSACICFILQIMASMVAYPWLFSSYIGAPWSIFLSSYARKN